MKMRNRVLTGALAAIMALTPVASAAAPTVVTDESVYVNMDYYGTATGVSIVKGCSLNGVKSFKDYGAYDTVTNMSNYAQPVVTGDGVSWDLPADAAGRFYYECTPKNNSVVLPWNVDVSYKLNGVPKKAEELAGASGLVEINVEVTPNEKARDYYKNNMLLQAATMVDMEKTLSVEAPGAQLQSLGTYKGIVFAALPGEHSTFTIRIGTNSFESSGIVLMMIPGTLEQLKDIKDIKEAKDTIMDSADAIHDSLNDVLGTLESMTSGFQRTQAGLKGLDGARRTISSTKGGVYQNADTALADLTALTSNVANLVPHLQNGQSMVQELNENVNTMVTTVTGVKEHMTELKNSTEKIQQDVEAFRTMLNDMNSHKSERQEIVNSLVQDIDDLKTYSDWLEKDMASMQSASSTMNTALSILDNSMGVMAQQLAAIAASIGTGGDETLKAVESLSRGFYTVQAQTLTAVKSQLSPLRGLITSTNTTLANLETIFHNGDELADNLEDAVELFDIYVGLLEKNHDNADSLLKEMNKIGDTAKKAADLSSTLVDNTVSLNNTLNKYKDGTVGTLKDVEGLTVQMSKSMTSASNFMKSLETSLKNAGKQLDSGTQKTLNGLIDILEKNLVGIGKTPTIINANDTIKNAVHDKVDKYEDENKFLNLDASLKPVSFTSDKNPVPASIQIVLRTKEISLDTQEDNTADLEKEQENAGVWARVAAVFQKIWYDITTLFS